MNRILHTISILTLAGLLVSCAPAGDATPAVPPESAATPPAAATPVEAATATATSAPPSYPERDDPAGMTVVQDKGTTLAFYDLRGGLLGSRALPPTGGSSSRLHISGTAADGVEALDVLRFVQDGHAVAIFSGQAEILRLEGSLNGVVGVPGQPLVAFGLLNPSADGGQLVSQIYLGTPQTLAGAQPVFEHTGSFGGAFGPLRIEIEAGQPVGIWYTLRAYGIGGHIIYDPTNGLYFLDLATGLGVEFTIPDSDIHQAAFSPDGSWLSYVSMGSIEFFNLQDGSTFSIPQLPESDRGGGDVTIAPGNQYVAWKEAHGSFLAADGEPDYYALLRVGVIDQGPVHDFAEAFFEQAAGYVVNDMSPVAWLDDQTLLVSLSNEYGARQLWMLDLSGPTPRLLADGDLAGFIYP
ncbi:MAG: hypothetical protein FJZ96_00160 [Chloroflexi bacterium]|nr:hypothetical protein [Chloroflexota bacterium]